ncbi:PREDICTED: acetylcholine receptor subunit alpha-type acr-16-like [Branchiostoma belcheri]|uniref:Acetylcholine receptor subunit alpha-type acr-16-like n=1 Tax=Branchiostoma belcheri TaxID=7741 RepID=A0A6P4ZUZ8_BRABE|nr:PREDICTED: acetylcholine receptor subunit alpha-type acr-16-like [Branchiostoma belcheri]
MRKPRPEKPSRGMLAGWSLASATRLRSDLLVSYDKTVIPQYMADEPVEVQLAMSAQKILNLDLSTDTLQIHTWLTMTWTDVRLKWDPEDYGVSSVRLPVKELWTPDITNYGSVDQDSTYVPIMGNAVISSDGQVHYVTPWTLRTSCVVLPPGEEKWNCTVKLGSWVYDGYSMDVKNTADTMDTSSFQMDRRWEVVSAEAHRHVAVYLCCPEPYIDVSYALVLQRRMPTSSPSLQH